MQTKQFFLSLSLLVFMPCFGTTSNERDRFLQEVLCPTGNPNDLPGDARTDYDAIKSSSSSWCAWLGVCTPNTQDALHALEDHVRNKSQEYARRELQPRPPVSKQYVHYVSHIILSMLAHELQKYEAGYPYCGLLNSFLGSALQSQVQTLIQKEQASRDREPILTIWQDEFATITFTRRLVEEIF
jgi:hypothetical protein